MANKIDITISAKDEASDVIDGVKDSFGELEGSADTLEENGSKSFGDFMDNVSTAMLGINQAIEVGMKVAEAAKVVYDNTVGKALTVAGEIEELMRVSGDAPETLSALRLEAEKADVPFDDLYKAMQNLNENGIAPTVDNLVAIADEYVNLQDPLDKAKLLTENFGTAGDDIAPMLEAIAGGVKAVDDAGLIFTEEEIQAANDYEAAIAGLKSTWDGFAIGIVTTIIPTLTDLVEALASLSIDGGGIGGFLSDSVEGLTEITLQFALAKAAIENFKATGGADLGEFTRVMWVAFGSAKTTTEDLITELSHLGYSVGDTADATIDATTAIDEATAATDDATWSVDGYGNAALEAGGEVEVFGSNSKKSAEEVDAMRIAAQETQKQIEDLQKALEGANLQLDVAIRTFSESIGGELAQGLKDAGLEGDELLERLGLIDQAFGTSYVLEYQMELNVDDLLDTLINDPDNFLPDAQQFLDYFTPLQESVITAMGKVDELETQLSELERTWNIRVKITTEGGFPTIPTVTPPTYVPVGQYTEAAGGAVHAAASGVAASLPHYWVGELGPEPFFPAQNGRIVSNTQAMSALRGGTNAGDIADAVKKGVKEAMRDGSVGSVYNLIMPTSSNPADIRMAFELMEAWGT